MAGVARDAVRARVPPPAQGEELSGVCFNHEEGWGGWLSSVRARRVAGTDRERGPMGSTEADATAPPPRHVRLHCQRCTISQRPARLSLEFHDSGRLATIRLLDARRKRKKKKTLSELEHLEYLDLGVRSVTFFSGTWGKTATREADGRDR
eukprot:7385527-Prymnesium_polylepis.1